MALSLQKGQSLSLSKNSSGGVRTKIRVGLGWELLGQPLDLDVTVYIARDIGGDKFMVEDDRHMIYFGQKVGPDACVAHSGDNRSGAGDGDDETVNVDFTKVESACPNADAVMVFVTIFEADPSGNPLPESKMKQHFGMMGEAYINIYDESTKELICDYKLGTSFNGNSSVHVGNFRKKGAGNWDFEAVGTGFNLNLMSISKHLNVPSFA